MFVRTVIALVVGSVAMMSVSTASHTQTAPSPVQPSPVKRTIIGKTDVPGSNYEVITALLEIQAGFKAGRHLHPGFVQAQVLEGEFWLALDGQPEQILTAGQSVSLPNRAVHNEGVIGAGPAKSIVVYIVEKGQALVQPVQ